MLTNNDGTVTLKTALDLTGLNQDITESKQKIKNFSDDSVKEFANIEKAADNLGDNEGVQDLTERLEALKERAKTLKQESAELDSQNKKTDSSFGSMAGTVRRLIGGLIALEAGRRVINYLGDAAQAAAEADGAYSSLNVSTNALTASQDNLQITIGRKVAPVITGFNLIVGEGINLVTGLIGGTNSLSSSTETAGTNFAAAATDGQKLNDQLFTIAERSANVATALIGVGQVAGGLTQVLISPFVAFNQFIKDSVTQAQLAISAIQSLSKLDFAGARESTQAFLAVDPQGLFEGIASASAGGFSNIKEGVKNLFAGTELRDAIRDRMLESINQAGARIAASEYATNLQDSTSSSVKSGVERGLKDATKEISVVITPVVSDERPSVQIRQGEVSNPVVTRNLTPATPNIRIPSATPGLTLPSVSPFSLPFQELTPVGLPANVTSSLRGQPRVLPTDISGPSIGLAPLTAGLNLSKTGALPDIDLTTPLPVTITNFSPGLTSGSPLVGAQVPQPRSFSGEAAELLEGFRPSRTLGDLNTADTQIAERIRQVFGVGLFSTSGPVGIPSRGPQVAAAFPGNPLNPTPAVTPSQNAFNLPAGGGLTGTRITAPASFSGEGADLLEQSANRAAIIQEQSAADFAATVIQAGSQFGNAVLSFASGDIGGGFTSVSGGIGSIVSTVNPLLGAGITAGGGFLGGLFNLFSQQDSEAARRAEQSRGQSVSAVTFNFSVTQDIDYNGLPGQPQADAAAAVNAAELANIVHKRLLPDIERLKAN